MQLTDCSWPEVQAYLERSRTIVIPTGSTEQHGPVGLIGTDALTAEAIASALGAQTGVLIAPTLMMSVDQFNLGFPGTLALRATTLMAVVRDCLDSLAAQGFQHIYFLNGHGGNIAPVRSAIQDFYFDWSCGRRAGTPPRCQLRSWWDYAEVDQLRRVWWGADEGMHATPSEISIVLASRPGSARLLQGLEADQARDPPRALSAAFMRDHGGDNHLDAKRHRAAFPDGRVGSHSIRASVEQGRLLIDAAVREARRDLEAFEAEH
jgi:creatinine amidohydrolase